MENNIIEGNKIIAKFAELETARNGAYLYNSNFYNAASLKYHSSWDWLMPVCIKFMGIKNLKESLLNKYDYWCKKIDDAVCTYDIQFACKTLVNAINWYNKEQNAAVSESTSP